MMNIDYKKILNLYEYKKYVHLLSGLTKIPTKLLQIISVLTILFCTMLACDNIVPAVRFFPVQVEGSGLDGLLPGTLRLDNGYLRIKYFDSNYLIIWPPGYSWRNKGGKIQVIDEKNNLSATVGDNIQLGGGETKSIAMVETFIGQKLPEDVEGPFWIVSEVVKE